MSAVIINNIDWVGVDWGTSHVRAWAMSKGGEVLARTSSKDGMGQLSSGEFEPALLALIGGWLSSDKIMPVIACGMVGSRQGWVEAPYNSTPCVPLPLQNLMRVNSKNSSLDVRLVPGLKQNEPADVMRGEETQITGVISHIKIYDGVICLPGTHSKWVKISDGKVERFTTFMTGELFSLLAKQSVLSHSIAIERKGGKDSDGQILDRDSFLSGVRIGLDNSGAFGASLFSIRAGSLISDLNPIEARAKLSGLLIGLELAGAQDYWEGQKIIVVAAPELVKYYGAALDMLGVSWHIGESETMTLAGLSVAREHIIKKEVTT